MGCEFQDSGSQLLMALCLNLHSIRIWSPGILQFTQNTKGIKEGFTEDVTFKCGLDR